MIYEIVIVRSAEKELRAIDPVARERIVARIEALAHDPHPAQSRRLKASDAFRLRVGDYRVVYTIDDGKLIVIVVAVGHRRNVYRQG